MDKASGGSPETPARAPAPSGPDHGAITCAFLAWTRAHKNVVQLEVKLEALPPDDAGRGALAAEIRMAKLESERLLDDALRLINAPGLRPC